jgi:ATP-binding cassette subfamily B (MDR/TAP) protein 1
MILLSQPLMSLVFGNLTQQFVDFGTVLNQAQTDPAARSRIPAAADRFRHAAANDASYLVFIGEIHHPSTHPMSNLFPVGLGIFLCTYTYMCIWVYTGEVNSKRVRERYLKAVLRQDVAFFDNVGPGEIATRIQTDTHLVQQGISEKVALTVSFISAFFTGFILAYIRSWRLALAMSSILPCIGITGAVMNKFVSRYMQLSLKHVAAGGTLAEEVISTVRTAQAFGTQSILSDLYDSHVDKSRQIDLKSAFWHGGAMATFFFVIYSGYSLGMLLSK